MSDGTYIAPEHGWTCFHCGETFLAPSLARIHFGAMPDAEPACQLNKGERKLAGTVRYLEEQLARYRAEDNDSDREFHSMRARHAAELRDAEQRGFDRGVADMRKHGWRLNEERDRPDLYPAISTQTQ